LWCVRRRCGAGCSARFALRRSAMLPWRGAEREKRE
jgi:hypothetical protein